MTEREKFERAFPGAGVFKYERDSEWTYRRPYDELWAGWQAAIVSREADARELAFRLIDKWLALGPDGAEQVRKELADIDQEKPKC